MSRDESDVDVGEFVLPHKGGTYHATVIRAGFLGTERIVPPAGEDYAFEVPRWRNKVEVICSPTGRSVQVFVNGEKWDAVRGEGAPTRKGGDGTAAPSSPSPPPTT